MSDKNQRFQINISTDLKTREKFNELRKESGYTAHGFIKHLLDLYENSKNNKNI